MDLYGDLAYRMPPGAAFEGLNQEGLPKDPPGANGKPRNTVSWQNKGYQSIAVLLKHLPSDTTTLDIYQSMVPLAVLAIELMEDPKGNRTGTARVRLVPPLFDFWYDRSWVLRLQGPPARTVCVEACIDSNGFRGLLERRIKTPLNRWVIKEAKFPVAAFGQGFLHQKHTMMVMDEVISRPAERTRPLGSLALQTSVVLDVNFERRQFTILIERSLGRQQVQYRIDIHFRWIAGIWEHTLPGQRVFIVLALDSPPEYLRKPRDVARTHGGGRLVWSGMDQWVRMTSLTTNQRAIRDAPVSLQGNFPAGEAVDLGRWTVFRLGLAQTVASEFREIAARLHDYDMRVRPAPMFRFLARDDRNMWACMRSSSVIRSSNEATASNVHHLSRRLSFEVGYQLEVCISRGILHEYSLDAIFLESLAALAPDRATRMLEYVAERGKRIFLPHSIFRDPRAASYWRKTVPSVDKGAAMYIRKAIVTPTTIVYTTPALDTGNRVLRNFREHHDRFLRVQFTDELVLNRLSGGPDTRRIDDCFSRVFRALKNGITVGGRHFEFLAFGNSQLRENGTFFFAPTELVSCQDIRDWMGDFSSIKSIAKYAARLGQCLSTTRPVPTFGVPTTVQRIPDVERGNFCFTDGVGKISKWWARVIATHFRIDSVPSAVQFRMGGCKGVLTVWPDVPAGQVVQVRPSQEKFPTAESANVLEIVRCSETATATLNQQTILLLTSLGIPASVFLALLEEDLAGIDAIVCDPRAAVTQLMSRIDQNQVTPVMADMVKAGFMRSDEPFVWALLQLWRSWTLKALKEKARITVEKSAFVLGCVDETDTLRGHVSIDKQDRGGGAASDSASKLPQIFLQVPDLEDIKNGTATEGLHILSRGSPSQAAVRYGRHKVITGLCLVGRNPSLHPGDLRVVEAVDVPELRHLRDVVVFPRTGDQDIPSMCSGGDLDGDDYFVFWDERLLPPREFWNHKAMDYQATRENDVEQVTPRHLIAFFIQHMKHDTLPTIALAHRSHADQVKGGALHPRCLELAQLHSQAVDFAKTGVPALMPVRLVPKMWPHWMERKRKASYRSRTALGQVYDRVQVENFEPAYDKPFDERILTHYPDLDADLLRCARRIKTQYDLALRRAMAQKEIESEFELWSGFSINKPRVGSDYKMAEDIGRLFKVIRTRFRRLCLREVGGEQNIAVLGPFVAAMYTVTYEELRIALHQFGTFHERPNDNPEAPENMMLGDVRFDQHIAPLISFPWLFSRELAAIAHAHDLAKDKEEKGQEPATAPSGKSPRPVEKAWARAASTTRAVLTNPRLKKEELDKMEFRVVDGVPTHRGIPLDLSAYEGPHNDRISENKDKDMNKEEDDFEPTWTLPPGVKEGDIVIAPTTVSLEGQGSESENDEGYLLDLGVTKAASPALARKKPFPWAELDEDVLSTTSEDMAWGDEHEIIVKRDEDSDDAGANSNNYSNKHNGKLETTSDESKSHATQEADQSGGFPKGLQGLQGLQGYPLRHAPAQGAEANSGRIEYGAGLASAAAGMQQEDEDASDEDEGEGHEGVNSEDGGDDEDIFTKVDNLFGFGSSAGKAEATTDETTTMAEAHRSAYQHDDMVLLTGRGKLNTATNTEAPSYVNL